MYYRIFFWCRVRQLACEPQKVLIKGGLGRLQKNSTCQHALCVQWVWDHLAHWGTRPHNKFFFYSFLNFYVFFWLQDVKQTAALLFAFFCSTNAFLVIFVFLFLFHYFTDCFTDNCLILIFDFFLLFRSPGFQGPSGRTQQQQHTRLMAAQILPIAVPWEGENIRGVVSVVSTHTPLINTSSPLGARR